MSIEAVSGKLHVLHATLCEIERGLFYVTYPDMDADTSELSAYQVSASAAEAKQQVETCAHALGYKSVIWNDANIVPVFSAHPPTGLGGSATI